KDRTPTQQKMMNQATFCQCRQWSVVAALILLFAVVGYEWNGRVQAQRLRDNIMNAPTEYVASVLKSVGAYRRWLNPLLIEELTQAKREGNSRKQLHASLALLPADDDQSAHLLERLKTASPAEIKAIREVF